MYKDCGNGIIQIISNGTCFLRDQDSTYWYECKAWLDAGNQFVTDPAVDPKVTLKAAVATKRWEIETGGITLPNGIHLDTKAEDQNKISNVIAGMEEEGIPSIDFKAASGFVTLTLADMKALRGAIARHVQACYSNERVHSDAIDAPDCDLENYDISTGWPEN